MHRLLEENCEKYHFQSLFWQLVIFSQGTLKLIYAEFCFSILGLINKSQASSSTCSLQSDSPFFDNQVNTYLSQKATVKRKNISTPDTSGIF